MRISIYSILFLLAWGALALPAQAQGPGAAAYNAAEELRKQGLYRDALIKYEEAIKLEPNNYRYFFQKGKCEYSLDQMDMAKFSLEKTVELRRNFTPAYSLLAKMYKSEENYERAVYYYDQAARYETDPARRVQYLLLAINLLLMTEQQAEARSRMEQARAIDPQNPDVLFYLAEVAREEEKWEEARQHYEAALASESVKSAPPGEQAKYYYGLGLTLSKLGDTIGARKAWSKANTGPYQELISQQMLENNQVYYYKIAVSYYLNGSYAEAERYVARSLEIQKNFASALALKARIEQKRGNLDQAVAYFRQALEAEKSPQKQAPIAMQLAMTQLNREDYAGALASVSMAEADSALAKREDLRFLRARAEYGVKRYPEAVETLEALLASGIPTKSRAKYSFLLGLAAREAGNLARAREAFQDALYGPYKAAAQVELERLGGKG